MMTSPDAPFPVAGPSRRAAPRWLWTGGALLIASLVMMPVLSVIWTAFHPTDNIWPHLLRTTLPRYLTNSIVLAVATGALAAAAGTGAAWLVTMYRFPMSRLIEWLLLMPLAVPAYIGAYVLVDFLEYSGPVQSALRTVFHWTSARDYWFPEIRSRWGAVVVLAAALYPYVYMLARAAFREQPGGSYEVARALGVGPFGLFWRVGLPLARPAIAAGTAIVMMETVNDFGVVDFFSVQTLTTGIFNIWLESGNAGGAAQLASLILMLIVALVLLERTGRARLRFHVSARQRRPVQPQPLGCAAGWVATALCLFPFLAGFCLPVGLVLSHALAGPSAWLSADMSKALLHTIAVGGATAALTVVAALFMVYGVRLSGATLPRLLMPVTTIGYAVPGAVLAVGTLLPLAALDHRIADLATAVTGHDPGLMLTGTAAALVFACCVRFFAIAQGAVDAALGRVPPSLSMAARSLGRTEWQALRDVQLPLIRGTVGTALLLVFVDCTKELPATLLLRPFNFDTLATRAHEQASLENIAQAAPPALMVILVGLVAVLLLARATQRAGS